jgi:hypothetical protein
MKDRTHCSLSSDRWYDKFKLNTQNNGQWWLRVGPKIVVSGKVSCNLWYKLALKT